MTLKTRGSGVLLHPTSLSGGYGIGDLGSEARTWIDQLAEAKQQYWQILPLGPTGYGDSPYQTFSAFAGNPLLIDLDALVELGYLSQQDLSDAPSNTGAIDFGHVVYWKNNILKKAFTNFQRKADKTEVETFKNWCATQDWLEEYTLYRALKDKNNGASWLDWPEQEKLATPAVLKQAQTTLKNEIDYFAFGQYLFFSQWSSLKQYANDKGVQIIGDVPIFVAMDAADAWANRSFFFFDEKAEPTYVAGVPPDYFSEDGQLWGNPLYNWAEIKKDGFKWWVRRIKQAIELYDLVRIDHFRGFEAYWEVKYGETTAKNGRWVRGPEHSLFEALEKALGTDLPIIAEDLGLITPGVEKLRDDFGLPGMKILQFSYDAPNNAYRPHLFVQNCVAYTGTHDNDTTRGWYDTAPAEAQDNAKRYLKTDEYGIVWGMIQEAWASSAKLALTPMQDLLDLDSTARLNTPGKASGNWAWRLKGDEPLGRVLKRLEDLTLLYARDLAAGIPKLPHADEIPVVHES
jgi:4-alpha-glucanotransferase